MKRTDFVFEEYKTLRDSMRLHQSSYFSLENYTFGGSLVTYGVLFGATSAQRIIIPLIAWWAIAVIITIACARCWGHYLIIRKISDYLSKIEKEAYIYQPGLSGFENYHNKTGLGPSIHLFVNAICWGLLLIACWGIAIAQTIGSRLAMETWVSFEEGAL
jgi:hypothetical protein